ncbi:MAG TPA: hypothetical protein VFF13_06185 [archaeon]|nr:hypothetical protein [archaeon]
MKEVPRLDTHHITIAGKIPLEVLKRIQKGETVTHNGFEIRMFSHPVSYNDEDKIVKYHKKIPGFQKDYWDEKGEVNREHIHILEIQDAEHQVHYYKLPYNYETDELSFSRSRILADWEREMIEEDAGKGMKSIREQRWKNMRREKTRKTRLKKIIKGRMKKLRESH